MAAQTNTSGAGPPESSLSSLDPDVPVKRDAGKVKHAAGPPAVKETHRICIDYNPVSGRKQLNTYEIVRELGRGEHGRVKLGYNLDTHGYVAIKLLNRVEKPRLGRPRGTSTGEKIYREIAILKKCSHPNIVKLLEVLDDESSRKIYLVLEYCEKGEIRWQTPRGDPALTRDKARSVARNVVLGLEYLHANGIIHRDIKPANLLVSADDVVKISDFGVSYAVTGDAQSELELAKTVGTPAFFAPELCVPTEISDNGERLAPPVSSKVDVWAFGVTLFCLLYGHLPFEADNEYELFRVIANEEVHLRDAGNDADLALANDLLRKLLIKDPKARPSMRDIKEDPWLVRDLPRSPKLEYINASAGRIEVSTEEVDQAVKGVSITNRIKQGLSRIAEQLRTRSRSQTRAIAGPSSSNRVPQSQPPSPPHSNNTSITGTTDSNRSSVSSPSSLESEGEIVEEFSPSPPLPKEDTPLYRGRPLAAGPAVITHDLGGSASAAGPSSAPLMGVKTVPSSLGMGLMPMNLDKGSLPSSKAGSLDDMSTMVSNNEASSQPSTLPEIPRLQNDDFWDNSSSSSSEDDDSGELTLVVSRNRSRSMDRAHGIRRVSGTN